MIIGHQKIIDILERELRENKLSQAYLFFGPENVGKKTTAFWLAKKILQTENLQNELDFFLVEPEKTEKDGVVKKGEIKIEQIRDLQYWLGLSSFGKEYKIAVIDDADKMNKSSQSSLLKVLEEPHQKNLIILVAKDSKKILPTLVSRCRKRKFFPVGSKEIEKMISDDQDKRALIFWSFGRPGLVKRMIDDPKEIEFCNSAFGEFKSLFFKNVAEKFSLAESLAKDVPEVIRKINLWMAITRIPMLEINDKIKISPAKALLLLEKMEKANKDLRETNVGARLVLENLFLQF